jgi:type IV secretion system protein VirB10
MSTAGLPFPGEDPGANGPEPKLSPAQGSLRAARAAPARFNGRIAMTLMASAAIFVVGAIFIPPMLTKSASKDAPGKSQQSSSGPSPIAPMQAISYDTKPADPTDPNNAAGGVDCAQYPGYSGCAGANAAAAASPAGAAAAGQTGAIGAQGSTAQTAQAAEPVRLAVPGSNTAEGARSSGLFFGGPLGGGGGAPATFASGPPAVAAQPPAPLLAPPSMGVTPPGKEPADVMGQNGQGEKLAFSRQTASQDYVAGKLEKPRSPYEVKAGSVISAALLTSINSDLPGEVVAQVTQPVYDHVTGRYVLIPQGSRLIGKYNSQIAYGQNRAQVVWHRVIFPNGNSLNFGNMDGTDPTGAAGIADRVNDHFGQLAKGVVLSTLLSVGTASAQDAQARSSGTLVLNSAASGGANEAQNVGSRIAERDMNRQPTITIRQGTQVRVLVDKDMDLEPYAS